MARAVSVDIGSNIGNGRENVMRAVEVIGRITGCHVRTSAIFESESWGYRSDNPFYNLEAEFESDLEAEQLLAIFKNIEKKMGSSTHRDASGGYIDRKLDIDIIYIGSEVISSGDLQVPHPRMQEREFVLRPLTELSPGWVHPLLHLTAREMLSRLLAVSYWRLVLRT